MSNERARHFFERVAFMREVQKEYYRTKDKDVLKQAIALEQEIDAEIARVRSILAVNEAMAGSDPEKPPDTKPDPPSSDTRRTSSCRHFFRKDQCLRKTSLRGGRFLLIPLCQEATRRNYTCPHFSPKKSE